MEAYKILVQQQVLYDSHVLHNHEKFNILVLESLHQIYIVDRLITSLKFTNYPLTNLIEQQLNLLDYLKLGKIGIDSILIEREKKVRAFDLIIMFNNFDSPEAKIILDLIANDISFVSKKIKPIWYHYKELLDNI